MFISAMKCPTNSHYEVCADNWALTCPGLTDIVFPAPECTEGCECNDGFSFNGETCIEENKCGCFDNGKSYKVKNNIRGINTKILILGLSRWLHQDQKNKSTFLTKTHLCEDLFALIAMSLHYLYSLVR